MTIKLEDRPLSSVKDEVVDTLIFNYSHGVISEEAFERRLDIAMSSSSHHIIAEQAADLKAPDSNEINQHKREHFHVAYDPEARPESEFIVNIFGGSDRKGQWVVPAQIKTISIFGGGSIDMTHATFTSKEVTIKALCLFGGENIYVPPGVRVMSSSVCIFGGVDNKVSSFSEYQGPVLRIEGLVIFGGISVKVKTSIKEMFVSFANQMKTLLNGSSTR